MNGDNQINADDQIAIVLRKIFFYIEIVVLYQKQFHQKYTKVKMMFEQEEFYNILVQLVDLSTLITKNRGINYMKSINQDQFKLNKLIEQFKEQITEFDYSSLSFDKTAKASTDLQKGRFLYNKFVKENGETSLAKDYEKLSETANVMNFECEDTICTNAQACQNQIKKILKCTLLNITKRKVQNFLDPLPSSIKKFCTMLGEKQIIECQQFIENGLNFLKKQQESNEMIDESQFYQDYDNVMFDLISGLFQTNKMIQSGHVPGAFVQGLINKIIECDFFDNLIQFSLNVTKLVESKLNKGEKIASFRLSYIKVMWRDIQILIHQLLNTTILHNGSNLNMFLIDFKTEDPKIDEYLESPQFKTLPDKQKISIGMQLLNQSKVNFKNLLLKMFHSMSKAFFKQTDMNVFNFFAKFSQKSFFNLVYKVFENLMQRFENMPIFKTIAVKKNLTEREKLGFLNSASNNYTHIGEFGRNYDVYLSNQQGMPNREPQQHTHLNLINEIGGGINRQGGQAVEIQRNAQETEQQLQRLMDMGFERSNAQRVLTTNNFERAIDILVAEQALADRLEEDKKESGNQEDNQENNGIVVADDPQGLEILDTILIEPEIDMSDELITLIMNGCQMILQHDDLLFLDYSFDRESQEVYGYKIRLDKTHQMIQTLLKIYVDHNHSDKTSKQSQYIKKIQNLFEDQYFRLFDGSTVSPDSLKDMKFLKSLLNKILIYKLVESKKIFDNDFYKERTHMNSNNAIAIFINILNCATTRLQQVFAQMKEISQKKLSLNPEELKVQTRSQNELEENELPMLYVLVQIIQEIIVVLIFNDELESDIKKTIDLASTVKDSHESIAKLTEKKIIEKMNSINTLHTKFQELFKFTSEDGKSQSSVRQSLSELMLCQVKLLNVYNNTPLQKFNVIIETWFPIMASVYILREIIRQTDIIPDCKDEQITDFRKLFTQNEGLKNLFGVRVVDHYCQDPDLFKKSHVSTYIKDQMVYGRLIFSFMEILINNPQATVKNYENQIKQLMFIQYKENCKRESKKDIYDQYKSVFEGANDVSTAVVNQDNKKLQSPKSNTNQQKKQANSKSAGQSLKKAKTFEKKADANNTGQNTLNKYQTKQLKILMKKNESFNEVPLVQFIEFFEQSQCSPTTIENPDLFMEACRNACDLEIVDNEKIDEKTNCSKNEKIVTIKLKNSVLKEYILEAGNELNQGQPQQAKSNAQKQSNKMGSNWQLDFKKSIVDYQFQHDIIQQLLDIFINQIKGHKMSILKCLKNNRNEDQIMSSASSFKIEQKDNKIFIADEKEGEKSIEMCEYLFDQKEILHVISNEIIKNNLLVGSVLKHKDMKTFKYIVRNIISLKYLKIVGTQKQIVFEEEQDELDSQIYKFLRKMLLNTQIMARSRQIYRQEARKIFIKEIVKNLSEQNHQFGNQEVSLEGSMNTKLLQNYSALLLVSQFLMTQEKKNDKIINDSRVRAIEQSIRRYNQAQKWQMLYQIIYEIQFTSTKTLNQSAFDKYDGVKVNLFKHIHRIRDDIQSDSMNKIIRYKPKALTHCIDTIISIVNQFSKKKEVWALIIKSSQEKLDNNNDPANLNDLDGQVKSESKKNKSKQGNLMDTIAESESDDEEFDSKKQKKSHFKEQFDQDDAYLTLEDRKDLEEMREEDRRSNLESASARRRGLQISEDDSDEMFEEEEEDELDDLGESSEDEHSYGQQDMSQDDQQISFVEPEMDDEREDYSDDEIVHDNDEDMEDEYYDEEMDEEGEDETSSLIDTNLMPLLQNENQIMGHSQGDDDDSQDSDDDYLFGMNEEENIDNLSSFEEEDDMFLEAQGDDDDDHEDFDSYDDENNDFDNEQGELLAIDHQAGNDNHQFSSEEDASSMESRPGGNINYNNYMNEYMPEPRNNNNLPISFNPEVNFNLRGQIDSINPQDLSNLIARSLGDRNNQSPIAGRNRSPRSMHSSNSGSQSVAMEQENQQFQSRNIRYDQAGSLNSHFESLNLFIQKLSKDASPLMSQILTRASKKEQECQNIMQEQIKDLNSGDNFFGIITNKIKLYQLLRNCIQITIRSLLMQLKTDQNLYLCNLNLINEYKQLELQNQDSKQQQSIMTTQRDSSNNQSGTASILNTGNADKNTDQLLIPSGSGSIIKTVSQYNQEKTGSQQNENNKMVNLSSLTGYQDFQKAIKVVSGEEAQTFKVQDAQNVVEPQAAQMQISSLTDTFDQIDPLFTQALKPPQIQMIKENDQLIRKMEAQQSSSMLAHSAQITTINDFLKKQSLEIRQSLLKSLEPHILNYLSSDLYAEAKKLRSQQQRAQLNNQVQQQSQQQPQIGSRVPLNVGSNQLASNRRNNQPDQRQIPRLAEQNLAANPNASGSNQNNDANFQRDRFISMESQTLNIETRMPKLNEQMGNIFQGPVRDSESEDLNIPQQRTNFHVNAFFFNIHTCMKENLENMKFQEIKDQLVKAAQANNMTKKKDNKTLNQNLIYTFEDLEKFCENLIIEQFKEDSPNELESNDNQEMQIDSKTNQASPVKTNINQLVIMLDLAVTEILCSKASLCQRQITPEKQMLKFKTITQIPNFRIGLIVKIIQLMNKDISGLINHVNVSHQNKLVLRHGEQEVYKGMTEIWDIPTAEQPVTLSTKNSFNYFVKYIYELQQIVFDTKGQSKLNILDLLKEPSTDCSLKLLYKNFKLDKQFVTLDKEKDVMNMTLFDQILQMIIDYMVLLNSHPEIFEFQESQEKEFNRWKLEILQNICLILQQINVSLNILVRKNLQESQMIKYQSMYQLSNQTLDMIFKIMFYIDQDDHLQQGNNDTCKKKVNLEDQSMKSIKMVSRVLNRISLIPIYYLNDTSSLAPNYKINLINIRQHQTMNQQESKKHSEEKKTNDVVSKKLTQLMNGYLNRFCQFFEYKLQFYDLEQAPEDQPQKSILSFSSNEQNVDLESIIQRIMHLIKISLISNFINENICEDKKINDLIQIVQQIINNEEKFEQDQKKSANHSFLFKKEFKLIMQLIFSISEYELKFESLKAKDSKSSKNEVKITEDKISKLLEESNRQKPLEEGFSNETARMLLSMAVQDSERRQNSRRQDRNRPNGSYQQETVVFQSIEEIKEKYNLKEDISNPLSIRESSSAVLIDSNTRMNESEQIQAQLDQRYSDGRIKDIINFFLTNKMLVNNYIQMNQTVINEQIQNLVIQMPEILTFESKRLLWRICIKKHIKKSSRDNGDYEIDIGVRRNSVFGDSFEQLKDIQMESWLQKFSVEFHDEEGVDEGGLTKEWYQLISKGIFDPSYALFQQSPKGSTYYPNPSSVIHEKQEMINMFKFVGRIIGKALNDGHLLDCYFVKSFYKLMLGDTLVLQDLEDFDEQLYKSLVYMLENDAEMLCQTFELSSKFFDEAKDIELKEGGKDIDVNNENKFEYCQLVLHYRLYKCVQVQIDSFLDGFHELVPKNLVKMFDYKELELMISGLPTMDISDLRENMIYKNYNKDSIVIQWLFEILEEFNNSDRAEFLQFVTGSSKVPVEGFKGLRGQNGVQKMEVVKLVTDKPDKRLPQAHTCFFQLDLPEYSSKEVLRQRISLAIREGKTFHIA